MTLLGRFIAVKVGTAVNLGAAACMFYSYLLNVACFGTASWGKAPESPGFGVFYLFICLDYLFVFYFFIIICRVVVVVFGGGCGRSVGLERCCCW